MATYAGRYDEPLIRKAGNRLAPPADGTTVLVYESDGVTVATLYTGRTKTATASNPVEVDASGNLEFFADPGTYVLSIREDGSEVAADTVTVFNDPAETTGGGGGEVADGDKGDITVTGGVWTVDAGAITEAKLADNAVTSGKIALGAVGSLDLATNAVTLAKLADIATASILGRATAGTGDPEVLTAAQVRTLLNVEDGATADQTGAEIKTAYEAEADTNAYTDAEKTKLAGVATGATANSPDVTLLARANHTGTQAQSTIVNLTTDLAAKADADGEYAVNTVVASGATETLTLAPAHRVTMDQNCTFTFPTPSAGHTFLLWLSGAFTPTFPASVDWDSATAPAYASPSLYGFTTVDGGTTWAGTLIASGLA